MSTPSAPNGDETHLRAIVFREGDVYVAQCLEYDISTQAADFATLLERLELTVEAEFEACEALGKAPKDCITPAPNYYHELYELRSHNIGRVNVQAPKCTPIIEVGLTKAA